MALTPSTQLFNAMMDSIATTPSYTGGDQGFLNALFAGRVWPVGCTGWLPMLAVPMLAVVGSRLQEYGLRGVVHACTSHAPFRCPLPALQIGRRHPCMTRVKAACSARAASGAPAHLRPEAYRCVHAAAVLA